MALFRDTRVVVLHSMVALFQLHFFHLHEVPLKLNNMATYKCSSLINVKEFKENVLSTVCLDEIQNTRDKKRMLKELDLGQETLTELSEVCR